MKYLIGRISVCLGLFLAVTACKKENKSGASPVSPADPNASLGPLSPAATASHILFGYKAYNSSGEVVEGTVSTPIASQICATETILGVTGNRICQDTAMTAVSSDQILSGSTFYDSTGSKRSGSLTTSSGSATAITGDENNDAVTQISVTPGVNELFSSVLVNLGAQFQKENICSGKTIFGRLGTAGCSLAFGSRGHRTPTAGGGVERAIPVVATDDDGMGDVTRPNTSAITSCGDTQATVAARIAHCNYSWDGEALGKMGEGKWSLVTKANGHEVWKDERTGMLWRAG